MNNNNKIQIQKGFQPIVSILCCWTYFLCQECKLLSRNRDFLLLYCIHFTWAGYCCSRYNNQIPPSFLDYHTCCGLLLFVSKVSKTYWTKQNSTLTYQNTEMAMSSSLGHNYRVESKFKAELFQLIGFCLPWEKFLIKFYLSAVLVCVTV